MTCSERVKYIVIRCECIVAFDVLLMRTPESEPTTQAVKKRNHYFHPGNMVLLRENHLATAAALTIIQLSCVAGVVS